jgi:hypothetical protein
MHLLTHVAAVFVITWVGSCSRQELRAERLPEITWLCNKQLPNLMTLVVASAEMKERILRFVEMYISNDA